MRQSVTQARAAWNNSTTARSSRASTVGIFAAISLLLPSVVGAADPDRPRTPPQSPLPRPHVERLQIDPDHIVLDGPDALQSLLVTGILPGGDRIDLTREAQYSSATPAIALVGNRHSMPSS